MKKDIHPSYHQEAKVKCVCGAAFMVGSTKSEIAVEICGDCHPFYTGKEKLLDTVGRIERFKTRRAQASTTPIKKKAVKRSEKKTK